MQGIIGHEVQRAYLQSCIEKEEISHAFFFVGPERVGKMTVARWFIDLINPTERLFLPSNEEGKESISIEDIRELLAKVSRSTQDGGYRVLCISDVDKLNAQSGNALLKCLEEPPRNTLFILIASHEKGVLQTLISRCATIRFSLVPPHILRTALVQRVCKDPDAIIRLSAGRPGCALRLMADDAYVKSTTSALQAFKHCEGRRLWERSQSASKIDEDYALEYAELYAHERVRECLTGTLQGTQQSAAMHVLEPLYRQSINLRAAPVLQSSKSFYDRLLFSSV